METAKFIMKIAASALLAVGALTSLVQGFNSWYRLWRAHGESYDRIGLRIAGLSFLGWGAISLIVFLWNPAIQILPILFGLNLIIALVVYQSVASPYLLVSWWRGLERRHKSRSNDKRK